MCGITGFADGRLSAEQLGLRLQRMTEALSHRGPDDSGCYLETRTGVGLGHRRLAIQDPSAAGSQPMVSADGRWFLVYNGEIYNGDELRRRLPAGTRFRGRSDTELLLCCLQHWGLAATLEAVAGMFAMALYDRHRQSVFLVRDRLGIKPLYYATEASHIYWASELKALMRVPGLCGRVDPESLRLFFQLGYVPAPRSIFDSVWKLLPGHWLEVRLQPWQLLPPKCYWSAREQAELGLANPWTSPDEEIEERFAQLLGEVVSEHLVSDVPLGSFLSGGVDSTLVTAMMQAASSGRVQTFSIGFDQQRLDEAPAARAAAEHLATQHREMYLRDDDVREWIERWPQIYCEPFSDTSALPTRAVSELARGAVSVALTGDGGDELFGGYRRYQQTMQLSERLRHWPKCVRRMLAGLLKATPDGVYQSVEPLQHWLAGQRIEEGFHESARKARALLMSDNDAQLYECLASISYGANRRGILVDQVVSHDLMSPEAWPAGWRLADQMQLWDGLVYLPNDILHKVDVASMSVGLEVRVPLLDHRIYEFAWQLPSHLKTSRGEGKVLLRRLLARHVPHSFLCRPKRGFSAPLSDWLRSELRDWAEALLAPAVLERHVPLNTRTIRRYWSDLIGGQAGHARIWPVLAYLAWQEHYLHADGQPARTTERIA